MPGHLTTLVATHSRVSLCPCCHVGFLSMQTIEMDVVFRGVDSVQTPGCGA